MGETAERPRFSWGQRLLVVALGVLIGALQVTIVETYQDLGSTIRWFATATERTTNLYNTQRETLKLAQAVDRLQLPDGLDELELHRSLLSRQLEVGLVVSKERRQHQGMVQIRGQLAVFDAELPVCGPSPPGRSSPAPALSCGSAWTRSRNS